MMIGRTGRLIITPPFSLPDVVWEVKGELGLSALIGMSIDMYGTLYEPAGYSEIEYAAVVKEDPTIYQLKATDGEIAYVPSKSVLSFDAESYVEYQQKGMVVSLGAQRVEDEHESLLKSLRSLVRHELGIDPDIIIEPISPSVPISLKESERLDHSRDIVRNTDGTLEQQIHALEDHNLILVTQVRALLEFIRHYLQSCCNSKVCFSYGERDNEYVYYEYKLDYHVLVESAGGNPFTGEKNAFQSYLRRWIPEQVI